MNLNLTNIVVKVHWGGFTDIIANTTKTDDINQPNVKGTVFVQKKRVLKEQIPFNKKSILSKLEKLLRNDEKYIKKLILKEWLEEE